jgi:hypothetical protein
MQQAAFVNHIITQPPPNIERLGHPTCTSLRFYFAILCCVASLFTSHCNLRHIADYMKIAQIDRAYIMCYIEFNEGKRLTKEG